MFLKFFIDKQITNTSHKHFLFCLFFCFVFVFLFCFLLFCFFCFFFFIGLRYFNTLSQFDVCCRNVFIILFMLFVNVIVVGIFCSCYFIFDVLICFVFSVYCFLFVCYCFFFYVCIFHTLKIQFVNKFIMQCVNFFVVSCCIVINCLNVVNCISF